MKIAVSVFLVLIFSFENTHSHCVFTSSKVQATCKQANRQKVRAKIYIDNMYFAERQAVSYNILVTFSLLIVFLNAVNL